MDKQEDLLVRNENIQHLFNWYCNEYFIVNRKYQRKLVWMLEEKQKFINSIMLNYPVPLILLAKSTREKACYEIIDGMQRLEAVFSFIRGEFPINVDEEERYFDLETMAKTKELLDKGDISQKTPVIKREICSGIANYQLPISIVAFDENCIEDIFRRINATGRQLSDQDLRQAGAVGSFAELVRKLASDIRRDSSPTDILELSKMREISLSNKHLPYGINMFSTFWVQQGIITIPNMRVSRDEELIAYILTYILLKDKVPPSAKCLNLIYGYEEDDFGSLASDIEDSIEKNGIDKLRKTFMRVFDEVEKTFRVPEFLFNQLLFEDKARGMARSFQVIFLSYYELITSGKTINNHKELANKLKGLGKRHLSDISSNKWNANYRHEKVHAIKEIISDCFMDSQNVDPATDNWVSKMENLLMQSKIEQQQFDFKMGLHSLNEGAVFNVKCIKKIVKTLTAIANLGKSMKGYVIVGIADKESDSETFERLNISKAIKFNGFFITGIQNEISKRYKNMDEYFTKVKQFIEKEPIDEYTKSYILRKMRLVSYFDKIVLVFEIASGSEPLVYDDAFYERRGTSVEKVKAAGMASLFGRFR